MNPSTAALSLWSTVLDCCNACNAAERTAEVSFLMSGKLVGVLCSVRAASAGVLPK